MYFYDENGLEFVIPDIMCCDAFVGVVSSP